MKSKTDRMTSILFAIYLMSLVWIIVLKFDITFSAMGTMQNVNLVPFSAPTRVNGEVMRSEMYLNMLIFMPFGIYLEILFKKWHIFLKVFLFFLVSSSFETLQYIFEAGASDITDIITNVLGGILGIVLYKVLERLLNNQRKTQKVMNIVALMGTISMGGLLFYLRYMN